MPFAAAGSAPAPPARGPAFDPAGWLAYHEHLAAFAAQRLPQQGLRDGDSSDGVAIADTDPVAGRRAEQIERERRVANFTAAVARLAGLPPQWQR